MYIVLGIITVKLMLKVLNVKLMLKVLNEININICILYQV